MKRDKNSNIIRATLDELTKLGYQPVKIEKDRKGNVIPPPGNSFLCLTNKTQDLWAEMSENDVKFSKVTPDKFLILAK